MTAHPRRDLGAPLRLLHRPLRAARAAADLERLHGRPLPGRRGDPLLQPNARRSTPNAPISLFFGDFGHMRAPEQGRRERGARRRRERLARLLRQGRRARSRSRASTAYRSTCPTIGALRRALHAPAAGPASQHGVVRFRTPARKTISASGGSATVDTRSTRSAAAAPARPRRPPTISPAWRPTACRRPPAAATR